MNREDMKRAIEAAVFAADEPVSVDRLATMLKEELADEEDGRALLRSLLGELEQETAGHGYELARVASGYRFQVRAEFSPWVGKMLQERPPRYSRALLETLALIAYRQPVTRGDIEDVRGVAVSTSIFRTLLERGWIRTVGQRETPGRPSLYGTTRAFLDYFNLKSLDELPPLEALKELIDPGSDDDDAAKDEAAEGTAEKVAVEEGAEAGEPEDDAAHEADGDDPDEAAHGAAHGAEQEPPADASPEADAEDNEADAVNDSVGEHDNVIVMTPPER